jgi:hypothetical protein
MKNFSEFNDYETAQYARGVAFAEDHWKNRLQPADADADSSAFMRGFYDKKFDLDFGPRGDDRDEYFDQVFNMLGLEDCWDYRWQLDQLDRKIYYALIAVAEKHKTNNVEDEENPAEIHTHCQPGPLPPPRR